MLTAQLDPVGVEIDGAAHIQQLVQPTSIGGGCAFDAGAHIGRERLNGG
jgi:hypothetical protein